MTMRIVEGRHGRFLCQDNDQYVGRSLVEYGEYSEAELDLLGRFLAPGAVVVEAGANIGAHTVPLARLVGTEGRVYAFEPQRLMHQMLCGNLALNEIENVYALAIAVGDRAGQTRMALTHYGADANYGGVPLGGEAGEAVAMGTIDALRLPRLDLIKADVEGAEALLVKGAEATILEHLPALYLENDRRESSPALIDLVRKLGYAVWWHVPFLFAEGNHFGNADNVFGAIASINILCQHPARARPVPELRPVSSLEDWPL